MLSGRRHLRSNRPPLDVLPVPDDMPVSRPNMPRIPALYIGLAIGSGVFLIICAAVVIVHLAPRKTPTVAAAPSLPTPAPAPRPQPKPPEPKPQPEPEKKPFVRASDELQAKRLEFITEAQKANVFGKFQPAETGPTIWVRPGWYILPFEDKEDFANNVYGYAFHLPQETPKEQAEKLEWRGCALYFKDEFTGKQIGRYTTWAGLELK